jgi:hypothetical protein
MRRQKGSEAFWLGISLIVLIWLISAGVSRFPSAEQARAHAEFQRYPYTPVPAASTPTQPAPLTAAEELHQVKNGCTVVYLQTRNEKTSDLTVTQMRQMNVCEALGLYRDNR